MEGHLSTGYFSKSSVICAKVALKMVIISIYFGKILWRTFTQILEKKSFNVLMVTQQTYAAEVKDTTLYGHTAWNTMKEK